MLAIYKYALVKYLKSLSTWIICAFTIAIVVIMGGFVPFHFKHITTAEDYAKTIVVVVASVSSFVSLFSSVFAGFKASTMFRDEIDDGVLLVMISKPVSRKKLFFSKWLSLQTIILGYALLISASFAITMVVADRTHISEVELQNMGVQKIAKNIIPLTFLFWAIISIIGMIFSSISLLISSKYSVGTTIGTSIAIGVILPSTMLISTFTATPAFAAVQTSSALSNSVILNKSIGDFKFSDQLPDLKSDTASMYNLGISTGDKDGFHKLQVFDIDYQIKKLSEIASETAISDKVRNSLDFTNQFQYKSGTTIKDTSNPIKIAGVNGYQTISTIVKNAWEITQGYRNELLLDIFDKLYRIEYKTRHRYIYFDDNYLKKQVFVSNNDKEVLNLASIAPYIHDQNADIAQILKDNNKTMSDDFADGFGVVFSYKNKVQNFDPYDYASEYNWIKYWLGLLSNWAKSEIGDDADEIANEIKAYKNLCNPIAFWVDQPKMRAVRIKLGYKFDSEQGDYLSSNVDTPKLDSLDYLSDVISYQDAQEFYELTSAAENGHDIVRIEHVEYSNKYIILLIYIGLALILIPASYFVIRRQDIR